MICSLGSALLAAGLWVVGQAQYTEDYCRTRAPQPEAPPGVEGLSGRPGYLDGPVTIRCEYDQVADVAVVDALPLLGALLLAMLVLAITATSLRWALRPAAA